nr:hypothetical protein [Candidatus Njordarchaeota archaeon]
MILRKGAKHKQLIVAILKKSLSEIRNKVSDIALGIKNFEKSQETRMSSEEVEAIRFDNVDDLIKRHVSNLKPLVGFNTLSAQVLALELLNELKELPTIKDLHSLKQIKLTLYRPGEYRARGVAGYAEKLFASRHGARSPNVIFLVEKVQDDITRLRLKKKPKTTIDLPKRATLPCLRSYSRVDRIDITGDEDLAVIEPDTLPESIRKTTNLIPLENVMKASSDIKSAHQALAGNVLLARRIQLSSPGAYWLSFYSANDTLGTQLPVIRVKDKEKGKFLSLYLNSVLTILQLLSFVSESRGAWVSLDHKRVWSHVHVPDMTELSKEKISKALHLFDKMGKVKARNLSQRLKTRDGLQREIDELVLEILRMDNWKGKLDQIYDAVAGEIESMDKILKVSGKMSKKSDKR